MHRSLEPKQLCFIWVSNTSITFSDRYNTNITLCCEGTVLKCKCNYCSCIHKTDLYTVCMWYKLKLTYLLTMSSSIMSSQKKKTLQEAVSLLDNWSADNHLNFNLTKCKYMIISRKLYPTLPNTRLLLSNHPLQRVFCYKYLGLLLTDNLSWSQHISSCYSKARQVFCTDDFTASPIKRHLSNSIFHW